MKRLILPLVTAATLIVMIGCGVPYDEHKRVQDAKDTAQIIAGLLAVGTVVALVVGTCLGSRACHDSK